MAQEMERLGGTSEEDLEEAEEDMEMEVKEEDPAVSEDGSGGFFTQETAGGDQIQIQSIGTMRRCRPKEEKERTKLRERHRRAITARILTGLRHHGNYNLRVRADINDVIAALAREAGWVVMPDGTAYPSSSQAGRAAVATPASTMPSIAPAQTPPLRAISSSSSGSGLCRLKTVYTPPAVTSYDGRCRSGTENCMDSAGDKQAMNVHGRMPERDFAGTPYVPVYVMLPLGVISMKCELVDPEGLMKQLRILKSINVDGARVDCWWGIVEAHTPQEYNWHGYKKLFQIVRELKLKLQVYFDYMRSFRIEFDEFFEDGIISKIEVGLGPCGELRYPSYPVKHGWRYPGIGEFQCYDQFLMKSLRKAAEARGHPFWARGPDNSGSYNSQPLETGFFCDGGDYDSYYGRFFLGWYSQVLVDHADRVLSLAKLAFDGTCITTKISGIHWWYKTASHAAELAAGFYNPCNRDGYASIASVLKKHGATLNITCDELHTLNQQQELPEALADPEGLVWQEKQFLISKIRTKGEGRVSCDSELKICLLISYSHTKCALQVQEIDCLFYRI